MIGKIIQLTITILVITGFVFFIRYNAHAVPSFKRQAGISCNACHTVFPELTPFGRDFKLNGYVLSKSDKSYEYPPPLSVMAQLSHTEAQGLNSGIAPFDNTANNKTNLPQQASLFYGGKIYGKTGALVQLTYSGVNNNFSLDNSDIRYADNIEIGGKLFVYGVTINNGPGCLEHNSGMELSLCLFCFSQYPSCSPIDRWRPCTAGWRHRSLWILESASLW
ncbi:MAG: hypothetical protein AB2L12_07245 [Smithellaceae bacterium]